MKIYLIKSKKSAIHIATNIYIYRRTVNNEFEITPNALKDIKKRYNTNRTYFTDDYGVHWTIKLKWLNFVYLDNIEMVKEVWLNNFNDVRNIILRDDVVTIDKIRLMEMWEDNDEKICK